MPVLIKEEILKKLLFLMTLLLLCCMMTVPAYADFTADGITVTIPDGITLTDAAHSKAISISGSLPVNKIASVTVSSANGFVMKNELNEKSTLNYTVSSASKVLASGDTVLSANSAAVNTRKTATLDFKLTGTPRTAGTYRDTLTFTLSLRDNLLSRIAVTTAPNKTTYKTGEDFDPTGMVVTAFYEDGSSQPVTGYTITDGAALPTGKTSVTVSYTEGSITKTASAAISVSKPEPVIATWNEWYKGSVGKENITAVTFVDSYSPTGTVDESWDASAEKNGSVLCYRKGTELIIAGNDSGYIKANPYSGHIFREFKGMTEINNLSLLDTSDTTSISFMFYECRSLKNMDISSLNTEKVTDMSGLFYMCSALETIKGLDTLYTSGVTNMYGMFAYCSSLTSLNVADFDTSKVTNMMYMFLGCKEVPVLDVSRWNTQSLENMQEMFCDCKSITSLDLSGWNTSNVTNMLGTFSGCENLPSIDIRSFDTRKVTTMRRLFLGCFSLTEVDIHGLCTDNVTDMSAMFWGSRNITSIDMRGINTANVVNMKEMFFGCNNVQTIYVTDSFTTSKVTDSSKMFLGAIDIKGAISYDDAKLDAAYANYTSGYFTYKEL